MYETLNSVTKNVMRSLPVLILSYDIIGYTPQRIDDNRNADLQCMLTSYPGLPCPNLPGSRAEKLGLGTRLTACIVSREESQKTGEGGGGRR